ncbi:hypothetical protein KI387_035701, partial [Taxus chinensis]
VWIRTLGMVDHVAEEHVSSRSIMDNILEKFHGHHYSLSLDDDEKPSIFSLINRPFWEAEICAPSPGRRKRNNEIAEQACKVTEQSEKDPQRQNSEEDRAFQKQFTAHHGDNHDGLEGMMTVIAQKIYSCLMLSIFFVE